MIKDRKKLAERVLRVILGQAGMVADELSKLLAPYVREGEELPDQRLQIELLARHFEHQVDVLVEAHRGYRAAKLELKSLERRRDQATAHLHRQVSGVRRIVDGAHGSGTAAEVLKLSGRTGRQPEPLLQQTVLVLGHLSDLEASPPVLEVREAAPQRLEKRLKPGYEELAQAVAQVEELEARMTDQRVVRDKALERSDKARRALVRTAVGYCLLIGREDLAERVRRFSRRRKRSGPKKGSKRRVTEPKAVEER